MSRGPLIAHLQTIGSRAADGEPEPALAGLDPRALPRCARGSGKLSFPDRQTAEAQSRVWASQNHHEARRAYHCRCGRWHLSARLRPLPDQP